MKTTKRIRTVLYGDQRLSPAELEVLHTPAMQRLYGLRQLGLADRVFIDASHARIHHVVGVLRQVDKLVYAIISNLRRGVTALRIGASEDTQQTFGASQLAIFVRKRRPVIRFIGLLHDLTHAPFGHTVEDEIRLVGSKHDEPERQADAFYRLLCQLIAWLAVEAAEPDFEHLSETIKPFLSQGAVSKLPDPSEVGGLARRLLCEVDPARIKLCWRLSQGDVAEMLAQLRCAMTALLHLEALHEKTPTKADFPKASEYEFQAAIRQALEGTPFQDLLQEFEFQPKREAFMLDIVGNTVCADLLDYAKRDSHFAGLRLDYDTDRIAENFTLVSLDASAYELSHPQADGGGEPRGSRVPEGVADPFEGWCLRTAISLVSHKYRTDIPSELMNLLNVRFYLYERAIFHPTKCAAGSMLGTALQLLGWRESSEGSRPKLPVHLRFVGDDVFLHDISASLDFLLYWLAQLGKDARITRDDVGKTANVDRVHNGLVPLLIGLRIGQAAAEAQVELKAARMLLDRLLARRYFRPVFRALPSSEDTRLQAGAEALADVFRQPDTRYEAERRIETVAGLPLGTVAIHCPVRTTAKKIANVLLTKPSFSGVAEVCKLKHIGSLDGPIFGEHQKAIEAVERMYGSMWRLTVYVAPEHLSEHKKIVDAAGRVIFETIDIYRHYADQDLKWANDPNLERELEGKLDSRGVPANEEFDLSPIGEIVGRLSDQLLESGRLNGMAPYLLGPLDDVPIDVRKRIEEALLSALAPATSDSKNKLGEVDQPDRIEEIIRVFRTYTKRIKEDDLADFRRRYGPVLSGAPKDKFDAVIDAMQSAILETKELDSKAPTVHKGYKFNALLEVLDALLKSYDLSPANDTSSGDQN